MQHHNKWRKQIWGNNAAEPCSAWRDWRRPRNIYQDVIFPPELDVLLVLGTENAGVQEQFIIILADVALLSSAAIR